MQGKRRTRSLSLSRSLSNLFFFFPSSRLDRLVCRNKSCQSTSLTFSFLGCCVICFCFHIGTFFLYPREEKSEQSEEDGIIAAVAVLCHAEYLVLEPGSFMIVSSGLEHNSSPRWSKWSFFPPPSVPLLMEKVDGI